MKLLWKCEAMLSKIVIIIEKLPKSYRIGGDNEMQTSGDRVRPPTGECLFFSVHVALLAVGLTQNNRQASPRYQNRVLLKISLWCHCYIKLVSQLQKYITWKHNEEVFFCPFACFISYIYEYIYCYRCPHTGSCLANCILFHRSENSDCSAKVRGPWATVWRRVGAWVEGCLHSVSVLDKCEVSAVRFSHFNTRNTLVERQAWSWQKNPGRPSRWSRPTRKNGELFL
jgi:hypothetical protein